VDTRLTHRQSIAFRLHRQHLDRRAPRAKLLTVVSRLCGLHAQVLSSAELTALCRIENLQPTDIPNALWRDRTLIKTWAMRATLHLLPATEYPQWIEVLQRCQAPRSKAWFDWFGITPEQLGLLTEAVREATQNRILTREQLADEVARLTGLANAREKLRQGWGSLLKPACYKGYLCFGPNLGQLTQFTHPGIEPATEPADAFVTRSFFHAYGPATEREFARWLQGGRKNVRHFLQALGEELAPVDIEGTKALMLRKDLRAAAKAEPIETVRLLPAFDQYVFAAGLRSQHFLPGHHHHKSIYKNQGWFAPVLLVDGRMDGTWNFTRTPKALRVEIQPFVKPTKRVRKAAEEEAERIAEYMQRTLELTWQPR
jgi:hypothetical protein